LLGDLSFQEGLEKIMRGYAGVYALYRGKRLYYVGLAMNLYNRLRGHTKDKQKRKWDQFAIFRVCRVQPESLPFEVNSVVPKVGTLSLTRAAGGLRENRLRLNRLSKAFRSAGICIARLRDIAFQGSHRRVGRIVWRRRG
jgi:hypothetical protein